MPDDTTKVDNQVPAPGAPPTSQPNPVPPVAPSMDTPPPPIQDGAASPPPPIVEEKKPEEKKAQETQTISDIPPVISTSGSGGKKPVSKKMIATILGILVLVGGIGAGVVLVQQQQDIREKAAVEPGDGGGGSSCVATGKCIGPGEKCCGGSYFDKSCAITETRCGVKSTPKPTPKWTPSPACIATGKCIGPGEKCCDGNYFDNTCPVTETRCGSPASCGDGTCSINENAANCPADCGGSSDTCSSSSKASAVNDGGGARSSTFTVTQAQIDACKAVCPTAIVSVYKYECDNNTNLGSGCQDNGRLLKKDAKAGDTFSINPTCGAIQIDSGCFDPARAYGTLAFASNISDQACSGGKTSPPPGFSCACNNIKAYDTEWNVITNLSSLKAGDVVRFAVAGTASSGAIDMARFTINGSLGPEVTDKKPGTNEFYTEYTIPEDVTSFTINAELHHTAIGWF